jgi:hypothetical protein
VFVKEAEAIAEAAREVAGVHGLPAAWLNDHVRVFVARDAPTVDLFEEPGLRVRMVRLDYLFYLKAWAGDPIDQRDLRVIAHAGSEAGARYDIVQASHRVAAARRQVLLESLFE